MAYLEQNPDLQSRGKKYLGKHYGHIASTSTWGRALDALKEKG
jgi:hypothetical protein